MADKSFGVKELNLIQPSGTPTLTSPNNLTINATQVSISTDVSIGNQVVSNIIVGTGYSVGIGTTIPRGTLQVGINTSQGVVLTSANGTRYRLFVENDGSLKTVSI
jgi:hypothetical protein